MKNRVFAILIVFLLSLSIAISAFAAEKSSPRVIDMADLLTPAEEEALLATLNEISERQAMEVTVATTDDLEDLTVTEYADLLYEESFGKDTDGILLLVSMETSDWWISTCGEAIDAFSDGDIDDIGNAIKPYLSDGDFAGAFEKYAKLCDEIITEYKDDSLSWIWIPICLVIGLVVALIAVGNMKSKLKTVRPQRAAQSYVKKGSMNVSQSRDLFLYSKVTRTEKPKDDSSTHTSSSGTTHGGGGGKF